MSNLEPARHAANAVAPHPDGLHLRCPHCHQPIEVVHDEALFDITCPACGSHFSLISNDATVTRGSGAPRKLAHFELLERVGEGQFGTVWKARDLTLQRIVALKIPRRTQLSAKDAEFFFRDARAAAQLRHANIVSVHEVGRDGDTIFIASDFIDGANLKEWLSARRLSPSEAAELMIHIASSLQHAHERGVVHRDLKPGNILMDEAGQPHITDFGLAKRDTGEITMTVDGQILGTPAYMSPEQARGKAHEADARSDVYSLGVILFELLTGEVPFRGEQRMLLVQILQDEAVSPRKLNARVPRDLETICLKCLEKEPSKRYSSALELTDELRRHLAGEPIRARPIGSFGRAWRWCRRNPVVAALGLAVLLLLSAAALLSSVATWQIARARDDEAFARRRAESISNREMKQRTRAENAERIAREEAGRANLQAAVAERVSDVLAGMYQGADPIGLSGYRLGTAAKVDATTTAVEILDRGAKRVRDDTEPLERELSGFDRQTIPEKLAIQLAVQAMLMDRIGNVYTSYMRFDDAEPLLIKALELRRRSFGDRHLTVAESLHSLGVFHFFEGDFDAAEHCANDALVIRRAELPERHLDVALSQFVLAWIVNFNLGTRQADAERLMRSAIETRQALLGPAHRDVAYTRFGLAAVLLKAGREMEATQEILVAAGLTAGTGGDGRLGEAIALYSRGLIAQAMHDPTRMADAYRQAVDQVADVFGERHPIVSYLKRELASALAARGDARAAEQLFRESLDADRNSLGRRPFVGQSIAAFANFLAYEYRFDEAEREYVEALDILLGTLGPDSGQVAGVLQAAARNDLWQGDLATAEQRWLEALRIYGHMRPDIQIAHVPSIHYALARVGLVTGNQTRYHQACEGLVRLHSDQSDPQLSQQIGYTCGLGPSALDDPETAVTLMRRLVAAKANDPWSEQILGMDLYRAGHDDEAAQVLAASITRQGLNGHFLGIVFLAMAHQRLGHHDESVRWLERAETWHKVRVEQKSRDEAAAETIRRAGSAAASDAPVVNRRRPDPWLVWDETELFAQILHEAQALVRSTVPAAP